MYLKFLTRTLKNAGNVTKMLWLQVVTQPLWNNTTMVLPSNVISSVPNASVAIMAVAYVRFAEMASKRQTVVSRHLVMSSS